MKPMQQEPIAMIEMVKFVVNAGIAWAIVMGFFEMNEVQQAATLTFALGVVSLVGAIWQRSQVTPSAAPHDTDGAQLRRPDGSIPLGVKDANTK